MRNLLLFNFKGKIIHAPVTYPGTSHDNKLATLLGLIFSKLGDDMTPPGMVILGDSAFKVDNRVTGNKVVRRTKKRRNIVSCRESWRWMQQT